MQFRRRMAFMVILGVETSCDETAASIVEAKGNLKEGLDFKLLGSAINSQIKIHEKYGGVVPNLAKREHQKNLPLVLAQALKEAGFLNSKFQITNSKQNLNEENDKEILDKLLKKRKLPIDLIAVTVGPGLEPALWAGITFAEELGKKWGIPVIGANHMEGHIASVLFDKKIEFPAIALLVSGGHTELVFLKSWIEKEIIGETQDDAVGEAFDKVARTLGLPYPGGPEISRLAEKARIKNISLGKKFPRPMIHSKDFNFSFSGLKTAVLYYLRNLQKSSREQLSERDWRENEGIFQQKNTLFARENDFADSNRMTVAREFEDAVVETLVLKTKVAIEKYLPKTLIIGGGVIANKALRENFLRLKKNYPDLKILIPEKSLTTDNATMIAAAGFIEHLRNENSSKKLKAQGNLDIN